MASSRAIRREFRRCLSTERQSYTGRGPAATNSLIAAAADREGQDGSRRFVGDPGAA
jgi:hypothetical protein